MGLSGVNQAPPPEYRLDQNANGMWTSLQGVYVWFDQNAGVLHFHDGSFWVMGSTSGGAEQDAGTMYPTTIEDRFGNQVLVSYQAGVGMAELNSITGPIDSSSRIYKIDDVRFSSGPPTYQFSYTSGASPHLASFQNTIGTSESGTFTFTSGAQGPPFGTDPNYSGATTSFLTSLTTATAQPYQFSYDAAGAGELVSVITPYGGEIGWSYGSFEYSGGRSLQEVTSRFVVSDSAHSGTTWTYGISRPDAPNAVTLHTGMTLSDASGVGAKTWSFNTTGAAWQMGLISDFKQLTAANGTVLHEDQYTWSQDPAGHPYISAHTSISDPGTGNAQSALTTQTLDQYGNVLQSVIYPYNNTTTPLRTYNNTMATSNGYGSFAPYYMFNLLSSSSVTAAGSGTISLITNYWNGNWNAQPGDGVVRPSYEYDANSPVPYNFMELLVGQNTNVTYTAYTYDISGNLLTATGNDGTTLTASSDASTNYAAPLTTSVQSYSQTVSYNAWLGITSQTGQDGEQLTMTYDTYGRPTSATSPYGAVATYAYPTVNTQTKTGPDGFTRTTLDGFGRTIRVERGTDSTHLQSAIDSVYAPCACSPLGKLQKVSQPYASGGSAANWTTYTYL